MNRSVILSKLDKERAKLQSECDVVVELLRKCVEENAHSALAHKKYQQHYTSLVERQAYRVIES